MTTASTNTTPLEQFVGRVAEISSLPTVAMKIIEVVRNPDTGAKDLMRAVGSDPALTVRLIRTVNSAAYGLSVRVSDLQHAIGYLGFTQVRNLALTASVSSVFREERRVGCYRRRELWRHMVSVAIGARLVAQRVGVDEFEDAFLAGLLHDIGIILIDQHANLEFRAIIELLRDDKPLREIERSILGFDHTQVGDLIAERWRLPPAMRGAIRHHHRSAKYKGEGQQIVYCVDAANVICTLKGIMSVGKRCGPPDPAVFQLLGLGKMDVQVLASDLDISLKRNECLFEML